MVGSGSLRGKERSFVEILKERNEKVYEVWKLKAKHNKEPLDEARWKIVAKSVEQEWMAKWIDGFLIKEVWNTIHNISVRIESLVVPESEHIRDEDRYQSDISVLRQKIDSINTQLLDCLPQSDSSQSSQEIIDIVLSVGRESIQKYLLERISDWLKNKKYFANICKGFKEGLNLPDTEILTIFTISAALFVRWSQGATIPGDEKREEVLWIMKKYIEENPA